MTGYKIETADFKVLAGPTGKGIKVIFSRKIKRNSEEYRLLPAKPKSPVASAAVCYRKGLEMITSIHISDAAIYAMLPVVARVMADKEAAKHAATF